MCHGNAFANCCDRESTEQLHCSHLICVSEIQKQNRAEKQQHTHTNNTHEYTYTHAKTAINLAHSYKQLHTIPSHTNKNAKQMNLVCFSQTFSYFWRSFFGQVKIGNLPIAPENVGKFCQKIPSFLHRNKSPPHPHADDETCVKLIYLPEFSPNAE